MIIVTDQQKQQIIDEAELLISEYETTINNVTDRANAELMRGFNVLVKNHGVAVIMDTVEEYWDFQWECPRYNEPIEAIYEVLGAPHPKADSPGLCCIPDLAPQYRLYRISTAPQPNDERNIPLSYWTDDVKSLFRMQEKTHLAVEDSPYFFTAVLNTDGSLVTPEGIHRDSRYTL